MRINKIAAHHQGEITPTPATIPSKADLFKAAEIFRAVHITPAQITLLHFHLRRQTYFEAHKPDQIALQHGYYYASPADLAEYLDQSPKRQATAYKRFEALGILSTFTRPQSTGGRRKYFRWNLPRLSALLATGADAYRARFEITSPAKPPRPSAKSAEVAALRTEVAALRNQLAALQHALNNGHPVQVMDRAPAQKSSAEILTPETPKNVESAVKSETPLFESELTRDNSDHYKYINTLHTSKEEEFKLDPAVGARTLNECDVMKLEKTEFAAYPQTTRLKMITAWLNADVIRRHDPRPITITMILKYLMLRHGISDVPIFDAIQRLTAANFPIKVSLYALFAANRGERIFADGQCVFTTQEDESKSAALIARAMAIEAALTKAQARAPLKEVDLVACNQELHARRRACGIIDPPPRPARQHRASQ
jgi:hypothetical protein